MSMPKKAYLLSEEDRAKVQQLLDRDKRLPKVPLKQAPLEEIGFAPDVYVAEVPTGGIPARVGARPGYADCVIHQLVLAHETLTGTGTGTSFDDFGYDLEETSIYPLRVHNLSTSAITEGEHVLVERDKFGFWFAGGSGTGGGGGTDIPDPLVVDNFYVNEHFEVCGVTIDCNPEAGTGTGTGADDCGTLVKFDEDTCFENRGRTDFYHETNFWHDPNFPDSEDYDLVTNSCLQSDVELNSGTATVTDSTPQDVGQLVLGYREETELLVIGTFTFVANGDGGAGDEFRGQLDVDGTPDSTVAKFITEVVLSVGGATVTQVWKVPVAALTGVTLTLQAFRQGGSGTASCKGVIGIVSRSEQVVESRSFKVPGFMEPGETHCTSNPATCCSDSLTGFGNCLCCGNLGPYQWFINPMVGTGGSCDCSSISGPHVLTADMDLDCIWNAGYENCCPGPDTMGRWHMRAVSCSEWELTGGDATNTYGLYTASLGAPWDCVSPIEFIKDPSSYGCSWPAKIFAFPI